MNHVLILALLLPIFPHIDPNELICNIKHCIINITMKLASEKFNFSHFPVEFFSRQDSIPRLYLYQKAPVQVKQP